MYVEYRWSVRRQENKNYISHIKDMMIKNIAFDLGGVVLSLDYDGAVRRFEAIGLKDARKHLDAYQQQGIFGQLEDGSITAAQFQAELGKLIGHDVSYQACYDAWHGYVGSVPRRNLDMLRLLRERGYQLCLLSNTNPYMMQWAMSSDFDGDGHPIGDYFDRLYLSYECRVMKPDERIFRMMLEGQRASADNTLFIDDGRKNVEAASRLGIHTLCPLNNEDWTGMLAEALKL